MKQKSRLPEKFVDYYDLIAALEKAGCAFCRQMENSAKAAIDSLLYESVTDPTFRDELRASRGFCNWHSRLAMANGDAFALSILYKDLVGSQIEELAHRKTPLTHSSEPCLICQMAQKTEQFALNVCRDFFKDPELRKSLQNADAFCPRHFGRLMNLLPKGEAQNRLWQWEREKLEALHHQLAEFIRKNDYRFHDEKLTEKEKDAWQRAMEWFAGKIRLPSR